MEKLIKRIVGTPAQCEKQVKWYKQRPKQYIVKPAKTHLENCIAYHVYKRGRPDEAKSKEEYG